jgi:hypothetical protein
MIYCYPTRPARQDCTIIHTGEKSVCLSVRMFCVFIYYDNACVLILLVLYYLCGQESLDLLSVFWYPYFVLIYMLGARFNLDVNPHVI